MSNTIKLSSAPGQAVAVEGGGSHFRERGGPQGLLERVNNQFGSIAGQGSQFLPTYMAQRQREMHRIEKMEKDAKKEEEHLEFQARREANIARDQAMQAKRKARREKKRAAAAKRKKGGVAGEQARTEGDSSSSEDEGPRQAREIGSPPSPRTKTTTADVQPSVNAQKGAQTIVLHDLDPDF
jgi:hypothetical protein